jgi:hypothetical protein
MRGLYARSASVLSLSLLSLPLTHSHTLAMPLSLSLSHPKAKLQEDCQQLQSSPDVPLAQQLTAAAYHGVNLGIPPPEMFDMGAVGAQLSSLVTKMHVFAGTEMEGYAQVWSPHMHSHAHTRTRVDALACCTAMLHTSQWRPFGSRGCSVPRGGSCDRHTHTYSQLTYTK